MTFANITQIVYLVYLATITQVKRGEWDSNPWVILGESNVVSGYQYHFAHGSCYSILHIY